MSERFGREIDDFDTLSQKEKTIFYREVPLDILTGYNKIDCEILWKAIAQFEDEIVSLGGQLQQTIASTAMSLFRRAFLGRDIFTSETLNRICMESYFASRVEVLSRNAHDFKIYDINSSFPLRHDLSPAGQSHRVSHHLARRRSRRVHLPRRRHDRGARDALSALALPQGQPGLLPDR